MSKNDLPTPKRSYPDLLPAHKTKIITICFNTKTYLLNRQRGIYMSQRIFRIFNKSM
jgi:hypothetical protein